MSSMILCQERQGMYGAKQQILMQTQCKSADLSQGYTGCSKCILNSTHAFF